MSKFFITLFLFSVVFFGTPLAFAEETVTLDLAERTANLYSWSLGIGVMLALGVLVFAGFLYVTSSGNPSRMGEAKKWITAAVAGLIVLFSSYLILSTINPGLTNLESIVLSINEAGKFIPPKITLPDPGIVTVIPPSSVVNGTYSCVWDENAVLSQKCKPASPNECRGGFVTGSACSAAAEEEQCEAIQDRVCEWRGGTSYDIFAAVARSYTVGNVRIQGILPVENEPHQRYVAAPPTDTKNRENCYGAECVVYVATVVQQTIDPGFPPRSTSVQLDHMLRHPERYTAIPLSGDTSVLRPGDILVNDGHIAIYLDDGLYEAGWNGGPEGLDGSLAIGRYCGDGYLPKGPSYGNLSLFFGQKEDYAFRYKGFRSESNN